jgi:hypothetical protein
MPAGALHLIMSTALCSPNSSNWSQATQAGVHAMNADFSDRTLPVERRASGMYTIQRSAYPSGIILIPNGHDPTAVPAVLPAVVTSGSSQVVTLDPNNLEDYGWGVTIVFT